MSATLDPAPLLDLLPDAVAIEAEGRMFPVSVHHAERPANEVAAELRAADAARRALARDSGDVLVFLPGMAEIRRAERRLRETIDDPAVDIEPLHGDLAAADQDRAIALRDPAAARSCWRRQSPRPA